MHFHKGKELETNHFLKQKMYIITVYKLQAQQYMFSSVMVRPTLQISFEKQAQQCVMLIGTETLWECAFAFFSHSLGTSERSCDLGIIDLFQSVPFVQEMGIKTLQMGSVSS